VRTREGAFEGVWAEPRRGTYATFKHG